MRDAVDVIEEDTVPASAQVFFRNEDAAESLDAAGNNSRQLPASPAAAASPAAQETASERGPMCGDASSAAAAAAVPSPHSSQASSSYTPGGASSRGAATPRSCRPPNEDEPAEAQEGALLLSYAAIEREALAAHTPLCGSDAASARNNVISLCDGEDVSVGAASAREGDGGAGDAAAAAADEAAPSEVHSELFSDGFSSFRGTDASHAATLSVPTTCVMLPRWNRAPSGLGRTARSFWLPQHLSVAKPSAVLPEQLFLYQRILACVVDDDNDGCGTDGAGGEAGGVLAEAGNGVPSEGSPEPATEEVEEEVAAASGCGAEVAYADALHEALDAQFGCSTASPSSAATTASAPAALPPPLPDETESVAEEIVTQGFDTDSEGAEAAVSAAPAASSVEEVMEELGAAVGREASGSLCGLQVLRAELACAGTLEEFVAEVEEVIVVPAGGGAEGEGEGEGCVDRGASGRMLSLVRESSYVDDFFSDGDGGEDGLPRSLTSPVASVLRRRGGSGGSLCSVVEEIVAGEGLWLGGGGAGGQQRCDADADADSVGEEEDVGSSRADDFFSSCAQPPPPPPLKRRDVIERRHRGDTRRLQRMLHGRSEPVPWETSRIVSRRKELVEERRERERTLELQRRHFAEEMERRAARARREAARRQRRTARLQREQQSELLRRIEHADPSFSPKAVLAAAAERRPLLPPQPPTLAYSTGSPYTVAGPRPPRRHADLHVSVCGAAKVASARFVPALYKRSVGAKKGFAEVAL